MPGEVNNEGRRAGLALGRALIAHAALLVLLLTIVFPRALMPGHIVSPAAILYHTPPWQAYSPSDFNRTDSRLMVDIVTLFYPMYHEVQRCQERGEWPLWNRLALGGMPLHANYETAMFYPPRLVYTLMDVPTAFSLHVMIKLWLCGMSAFLCGNGIGLTRNASRFLSIGWMLATYNVSFAGWTLPDVSAWVPILFWGVHSIVEGRYRTGATIAALGATLLLFAGHPELAFGGALGIGVYFVFRLGLPWRGWPHAYRAIAACSVFWLVALFITSVQTVPFIEYAWHSARGGREALVEHAHFTPASLVALWVPRFYGLRADYTYWGGLATIDSSVLYPGMAVWIGIAAIAVVPGLWKRPSVIALVAANITLLAAAYRAPALAWLTHMPLLNLMASYWYIAFPVFATPLLGAIGLDAWMREGPSMRRMGFGAAVLVPCVAVVAFAYAFHRDLVTGIGAGAFVTEQIAVFGAFLVLGCVVVAAGARYRRYRLAGLLLTVLLATDLLIAGRSLNPVMPRDQVYPETALTRYLQALPPPARIAAAPAKLPPGILAHYGIETWLGFDGIYPERVPRLQHELGRDLWNAFEPACAIQYYLHNPAFPADFPVEEPGRFTKIATLDGIDIYRNHWALPHAYFTRSVEIVESPEELFERLKSSEFDPRETALVLREDVPATLPAAVVDLGSAEVTSRTGTRVSIAVHADDPQVLVLADAFYPGWRARIDGEFAPVFPVFYAFRGLVVPPGAHTVEYVYRPLSFYGSAAVSTVSLAIALIVGLFRLRSATRCISDPMRL